MLKYNTNKVKEIVSPSRKLAFSIPILTRKESADSGVLCLYFMRLFFLRGCKRAKGALCTIRHYANMTCFTEQEVRSF